MALTKLATKGQSFATFTVWQARVGVARAGADVCPAQPKNWSSVAMVTSSSRSRSMMGPTPMARGRFSML